MITYNVYLSGWGGSPEDIDFSAPAFTSPDTNIIIPDFVSDTGGSSDGTIYLVVRAEEDGIEEQNFNVIAFTLFGGEWTGRYQPPVPNVPVHLSFPDPVDIDDAESETTWIDGS